MFAPSPRLQSGKTPILLIAGAIALLAIIVGGQKFLASRSAPADQRSAAPRAQGAVVRTSPVTTGIIRSVFSYAGSVQATDQVSLVPKPSGIISPSRSRWAPGSVQVRFWPRWTQAPW